MSANSSFDDSDAVLVERLPSVSLSSNDDGDGDDDANDDARAFLAALGLLGVGYYFTGRGNTKATVVAATGGGHTNATTALGVFDALKDHVNLATMHQEPT